MISEYIQVNVGSGQSFACESVIVVPEKAIEEAGYIRPYTIKDSAHAKHEYHAMGQMAFYQYQDEELDLRECAEPIEVCCEADTSVVDSGMVFCRDPQGEFFVLVNGMMNRKKLIETAHRYCTRWVRLDI